MTLSTTTRTQDFRLLDLLVPLLPKRTGSTVKTISMDMGQALPLVATGEAEIGLVHAPDAERTYAADGQAGNR